VRVGVGLEEHPVYLPLAGFLVNLVIALGLDGDDWKVTTLKVGSPGWSA
jgi:hypothetical protein